eukprot:m.736962 g.736962  ORF g.736962 m.736962 type:complete len:72 (-) comp23097_c0_seq28:258-473(-)
MCRRPRQRQTLEHSLGDGHTVWDQFAPIILKDIQPVVFPEVVPSVPLIVSTILLNVLCGKSSTIKSLRKKT